ncbi:imidazolonepropionase [Sporolactobacillus spathodeae]|uniref:Imidazolonepropionase n=1 Tax=Sporolactobacillus spathodeae TaxID=1465502 RepID=A0ABS2Q8Z5_9BACL|nr:imidazolonepropionase [Sporolactobacillus spathodeae]MBM7658126.1 imidazolonepropionase [Sporolactobacillus spathodeae]
MTKLMLVHAAEIATPTGKEAVSGSAMNQLQVIHDGAVVIEAGIIQAVGPTETILKNYDSSQYSVIDATNQSIVPGFVDSHTHFVFGGYRPDEFLMRLSGKSYMEIMEAGGGIENTVQATRSSSFDELYQSGFERLDEMLAFGVTTVEGKSGYGLDHDNEIKQLGVMQKLNASHPVDVVSTFLGAHAVPREFAGRNSDYIDFLISDVLPEVASQKLADYCDAFCEKGVISIDDSRRLLAKAKALGMRLKLHADEIEQLGGAELAAELGAASADHLLEASDTGIGRLAEADVVATLLPATAFCLNKPYAPARKMIDQGCAVALASDLNPGSCFTGSVPLIFSLACIYMKMSVAEALTAFTLNGAAALNRADRIGSIEVGKEADLLLLKYPSYSYLVYKTAVNCVDRVIKKGKVIKN